jgi:hypothetical protein
MRNFKTRERGTRDRRCRERHNFFNCLRFGLRLNPIVQLQNLRVGLVLRSHFPHRVGDGFTDGLSRSTIPRRKQGFFVAEVIEVISLACESNKGPQEVVASASDPIVIEAIHPITRHGYDLQGNQTKETSRLNTPKPQAFFSGFQKRATAVRRLNIAMLGYQAAGEFALTVGVRLRFRQHHFNAVRAFNKLVLLTVAFRIGGDQIGWVDQARDASLRGLIGCQIGHVFGVA